jgi:hypothetical protein
MCRTPYQNSMTDAIGAGGDGDEWPVVVEDGVITQFGFTEHSWILDSMGTFLVSEGRSQGYEDCLVGPFPESCATIQLENLDAWAEWLYESFGQFTGGGELADEYAAADCANTPSSECADLIGDNFEAWETWNNANA